METLQKPVNKNELATNKLPDNLFSQDFYVAHAETEGEKPQIDLMHAVEIIDADSGQPRVVMESPALTEVGQDGEPVAVRFEVSPNDLTNEKQDELNEQVLESTVNPTIRSLGEKAALDVFAMREIGLLPEDSELTEKDVDVATYHLPHSK